MLGMSLAPRMEPRQTMRAEQRQHIMQSQMLSLRLELVAALRGDPSGNTGSYRPMAHCNKCGRDLTPLEIIKGFNTDPNDFTTQCSGCKTRFNPKLVWRDTAGSVEIPFYCNMQTQAQLRGLEVLSPVDFQRQQPALYHSAVVHNGTLKAAFARLDIAYDFVEITDPAVKIKPFLGRLPDTIIAEVSGVKLGTIRRLRKKHGIKACTQRVMLEEAESKEPDIE